MGSKSSSAPAPDPRLVEGQLKSMGIQDTMITKLMSWQDTLAPIQLEEMQKGILRDDLRFQREGEQFGFTMDYNRAALASQSAAASGANAAAMAAASAAGTAAGANVMTAQSNAKLADNAIKMNDYQYAQMQERDKRWREVGMPQEDALIAKVNEMGSEKYRDRQLGMAVGDVQQGLSDSRGKTMRDMSRAGVDTSSGAFASMMARGTADQGLALAGAKNSTRTSLAQMDLANKFQLNGAMKGMAGMGDMSAGLAINAINAGKNSFMSGGGGGGGGGGFSPMGFGGSAGGGGGGGNVNQAASGILNGFQMGSNMAGNMGSNATGMWNAQASYKNQQDQIANANNPWSSMLGAATGVGLKWAMR